MKLLYDHEYTRQLMTSIIIVLFSIWINVISIQYINSLPYTEYPHDILQDIFEFHSYYSILAEILLIMIVLIFIYNIIKFKEYQEIPFYLTCIGIFYIIRAIILPLTPLQSPYPDPGNFGLFYRFIPNGGTFPSGHSGFAFLLYLMINPDDKKFKTIMLSLAILLGFFMIISRGHYTIDVIGGFLIAYFVISIMDRYKRDLFNKRWRFWKKH